MMHTFTRLCRQYGWYLGMSVAVYLNPVLAYAAPVTALPYKPVVQDPIYYGSILCTYPDYTCNTVKHGDTWEKMFPNERERDLVQRVNRTYNRLTPGQIVVVPKLLATASLLDLAPFAHNIADTERQIIVDQDKLAWAAYNEEGQLVKWGPIASGRDKCSDSANSCRTLTGVYRVFSKEDSRCKSDVFPIGRGGAKMPYCMYFHKGFALHGADDMPGFRASHGCVRMFNEDAKWMNLNFVESSSDVNQHMGTKVVVRPLSTPSTFIRSVW